MAESLLKKGLNWVIDRFHSVWLETVAEVSGKEAAEAKETRLEGFIPVTNPATDTLFPLPISTAVKSIKFHLHLNFLGLASRMPVSEEIYSSLAKGDRIRLRYQLDPIGHVKATKIEEIIKSSPEEES